MSRIVSYVAFATGWTREYILHTLTWRQLIQTAEHAADWSRISASTTAAGIIQGIVPRTARSTRQPTTAPRSPPEPHKDDGGIGDLIRSNLPV